jgi:hypothetical protein
MCAIFPGWIAKFGRKCAANTIEFLGEIQQRGLRFLPDISLNKLDVPQQFGRDHTFFYLVRAN